MKYLLDSDLDPHPEVLNFDTAECAVKGSRDIYTLKSTRNEKRMYSELDSRLESRHENALRISASLPSDTDDIIRSLNLGLSSPFGPLSIPANRRLFAYLVATLQNSHPDYSFSNFMEPDDFVQESHYQVAVDRINTEVTNLSWSNTSPSPGESIAARLESFWEETNNLMSLASCNVFSWSPKPDTNYDRDEENIWSLHYFFFNRYQKRICYIYLCSKSAIGRTPYRAIGRSEARPFQYLPPTFQRSSSSSSALSWDRWTANEMMRRERRSYMGSLTSSSLLEDDDFVIQEPGDDEVDNFEGSPAYVVLPVSSRRSSMDGIEDMEL